MQLATFQSAGQRDNHPIANELRDTVTFTAANAPRNLQVALGPSEIGEPCTRKLAYRLMDEPRVRPDNDLWASTIGVAVHAWLADAFTQANQRLGRIRYLVEHRVEVRPGLTGSCDLYDADRATVIDHKVVNPTKLRHYRINGPSEQYQVQAHAYGMGYTRLGLPVEHVAVAFYPRSTDLSDLHIWSEPYNPDIVLAALAKHDILVELISALDVEHHISRYKQIPITPGDSCTYCPWLQPGPDNGIGCPGNTQSQI